MTYRRSDLQSDSDLDSIPLKYSYFLVQKRYFLPFFGPFNGNFFCIFSAKEGGKGTPHFR